MSTEDNLRALLDKGEIEKVFRGDLLWDRPVGISAQEIYVDDHTVYSVRPVAAKKNFVVFECDGIPEAQERIRIERAVSRRSIENLLVYKGAGGEHQIVWTEARPGRPPHPYVHRYDAATPNADLLQRLAQLKFTLGEQTSLNLMSVRARVQQALAADKVTKKFYDSFAKQHKSLVGQIENLPDDEDRSWYASVLMNRLMFLYFLQRKGFLDNDTAYLTNRLSKLRALQGPDQFFTFFRRFLLPLFHTRLAERGTEPEDDQVAALIGDVPYLNGGMFAKHELELRYAEVDVPDAAFEAIFRFFDSWKWTLDDSQVAGGNEINPDILGYIFERYINQKQMGAYYTKEDVTGYMTSVTVLPWLLDRMSADLAAKGIPFDPYPALANDPDRYLYAAPLTGVDTPLPLGFPNSVAGIAFTPQAGMPASEKYGLPGESWIECLDRHEAQRALRDRLASGHITSSGDAVTANINLIAFVTDMLRDPSSPEVVRAAYEALCAITVLDPACGSGAFLFAALDLLVVLYRTCLETMEQYLKDEDAALSPDTAKGFRAVLDEADKHASRDYFLYKSATLNNLYGVDLMPEAVEIAKLRLFLSLVEHVHTREELDPLPDLDFNLRAGNSLVGFGNLAQVEDVLTATFDGNERLDDVVRLSQAAGEAYERFAQEQVNKETSVDLTALKIEVETALRETRSVLNAALAEEYGVTVPLEQWVRTVAPFHWYTEFYSVMNNGGFDVVVGNPPYVAKTKVGYTVRNLSTATTPDIYAPMTERGAMVCATSGRMAMIVPISSQFGDDFAPLREVLEARFPSRWISTFSRNPAALFEAAVGVRSTIIVAGPGEHPETLVTRTNRWVEANRPALFESLRYHVLPQALTGHGWMRIINDDFADVAQRLIKSEPGRLGANVSRKGTFSLGYKTTCLYWLSIFAEDPPAYQLSGSPVAQSEVGNLRFFTERERDLAQTVLLSKFSFVWWYSTGDDFHVTGNGLARMPMIVNALPQDVADELLAVRAEIEQRLPQTIMFTPYNKMWIGNFAIPEIRDLTDKVDKILAQHYGYTEALPSIDLAYHCVYKPTGQRPGVVRTLPFLQEAAP